MIETQEISDTCQLTMHTKITNIDLIKNPQLAPRDQIMAVPTLVRKVPLPIRKVIGHLSNTERVFVGLDLRPRGTDRLAVGKGQKHGG
jgi:KaiB domain